MISIGKLCAQNVKFLRRSVFKPYLKALSIRMISFYQRRFSHKMCLYTPTCSEYTKRCINNYGVVVGSMLGFWRILRCNPLSKGGIDPAPEVFWKRKWLI